MPDVPSSLPSDLIAGTTWQWTLSLADYPAPTWTASVHFEKASKTFSATGSPSGMDHAFSVPASTTAAYPPGRYRWRVRVTDGTNVYIVNSGWVDVEVDPAAAGTSDPRSWARRTLDNLLAFLEQNALTSQASITIQGRSIARWQIKELDDWRVRLEAKVRTEEQSANGGRGRDIKIRLRRA